MGVPSLDVGYTSTTTGRGDHEVHKGHVVALEKKNFSGLNDCSWHSSARESGMVVGSVSEKNTV
jgi:hypothetical protein